MVAQLRTPHPIGGVAARCQGSLPVTVTVVVNRYTLHSIALGQR